MARMNGNISDLFFNIDLPTSCKRYDEKGRFVEFIHAGMLEEADTFLGYLLRLGVPELPTAKELVQDFYARV